MYQGLSLLVAVASLIRCSQLFQSRKVHPCVLAAIVFFAAHVDGGLQLGTHQRTIGVSENLAAKVVAQLDASHPGRLA